LADSLPLPFVFDFCTEFDPVKEGLGLKGSNEGGVDQSETHDIGRIL
jgi:hypothetical protein